MKWYLLRSELVANQLRNRAPGSGVLLDHDVPYLLEQFPGFWGYDSLNDERLNWFDSIEVPEDPDGLLSWLSSPAGREIEDERPRALQVIARAELQGIINDLNETADRPLPEEVPLELARNTTLKQVRQFLKCLKQWKADSQPEAKEQPDEHPLNRRLHG